MSSILIVGDIAGAFKEQVKQVAYPGKSFAPAETGSIQTFSVVQTDELFPQSGMDSGYSFVIPVSGIYTLIFNVDQPGYNAPGVGWTNGWSGEGNGAAWIRRKDSGGTILEDNIARQTWASADYSAEHWMYCGPVNRALNAGDKIEFWTLGFATGVQPSNWDALGFIKKLKRSTV